MSFSTSIKSWHSVGFWASLLCAIHCMAMPLVVMAGSVYGVQVSEHSSFEIPILSMAVLFAIIMVVRYYFHHRNSLPLLLLIVGVSLLLVSVISHTHLLTIVGSLVLASAQLYNTYLHHRMSCAH
jgi:hypothetical protein